MMRGAVWGFVCFLGVWAAADPVTTRGLIDELVDMHRLAAFPNPAYKTVQFSSHDRMSDQPGGPHWYGNSDGFGGEQRPNFESVIKVPEGDQPGEYVMCDIEGPGAIVRTWSARSTGTIRLYLDGNAAPAYEGPAEAFLKHPYDTFLDGSGLAPDVLANAFYQRDAAYTPIPFAKGCKIVWIGNHKEIHFYEIQARLYEAGTKVETFSAVALKTSADRIRSVADILRNPDTMWPYQSTAAPTAIAAEAAPHTLSDGMKIAGPGAFERLVLKVKAADRDRALREVILHIRFDGYPWPQVQAPIGDFFGAGPGINPYTSAPFTVAQDGTMTCRYVMPFASSAEILVDNRGDQAVTVTGSVLKSDYTWDDATSMHFRARWRVDHGLVAAGDPMMGGQDLPFLVGRGRGVYVGTAVMLLNPNNVPSSGGNWWGEGDEKIFVDDDVLPSTFGTGSEDYFNYSWSATDIFMYPYCGQPRNDGPANRGFVVNYRYHVVDALPFQNSIAFYMELFSHERTPGFSYARLSYHYAAPGFVDDHVSITDEDVRHLALPATWEPAPRGAVHDFVFYPVEALVGETNEMSFVEGSLWQGGSVMVWTPRAAGDRVALKFDAPEGGNYEALIVVMLQPGAGSFRAELDGKPVAFAGKEVVDMNTDYRTLSRDLRTGLGGLAQGQHTLTFSAVEGSRPIGLDFFGIRKN